MVVRGIRLSGFEVALAEFISERYVFTDPALKNQNFGNGTGHPVVNRHLFVQDMIEVGDVAKLFDTPNVDDPDVPDSPYPTFNPKVEPQIALFTDPTIGVVPSASTGHLHLWAIRFVLRLGTVPEPAKRHLEDFLEFVGTTRLGGKLGRFLVKGREILARPQVIGREGDDHSYINSVVRYYVVPLPR